MPESQDALPGKMTIDEVRALAAAWAGDVDVIASPASATADCRPTGRGASRSSRNAAPRP